MPDPHRPTIGTRAVGRRAVVAGLVATPWLSLTPARAQAWPARALRIVVPNAAGGAADITARTVGQKLAEALGQPVVIENRPSAGGIVAGENVARAEPDGHSILLISSGTAVSAALFKSLPFDTVKDFAPVSLLATFDLVLAVAEGGPHRSLAELLSHARANPGKLNIGTPQVGTTQNLAAELFKATAGIDAQVVPFNGTPPALQALRGGQLDAIVDILGPVMPQIQAKALRPVAVLGERRPPQLPDVPAAREAGGALAAFNVSSWNGLAVPARTPRDVIQRLSAEVNRALALPDVAKRMGDLNLNPRGSTPEQAAEHLQADIRRWSDVITRAKIEKQ